MKGKHAKKKKFRAVGAMAPTPLSLKTRGGRGRGCRIQGPGPATPPGEYVYCAGACMGAGVGADVRERASARYIAFITPSALGLQSGY